MTDEHARHTTQGGPGNDRPSKLGMLVIGVVVLLGIAGFASWGYGFVAGDTGPEATIEGGAIESVDVSDQLMTVELSPNHSVDRVEFYHDGYLGNHAHVRDGQTTVSVIQPWGRDYTVKAVANGSVVSTASGTK